MVDVLRDYQETIINDRSSLIFGAMARRSGKTEICVQRIIKAINTNKATSILWLVQNNVLGIAEILQNRVNQLPELHINQYLHSSFHKAVLRVNYCDITITTYESFLDREEKIKFKEIYCEQLPPGSLQEKVLASLKTHKGTRLLIMTHGPFGEACCKLIYDPACSLYHIPGSLFISPEALEAYRIFLSPTAYMEEIEVPLPEPSTT